MPTNLPLPEEPLEAPAYAGRSRYADAVPHRDRWNPALRALGPLFGLLALATVAFVGAGYWLPGGLCAVGAAAVFAAIAAIGVRDIRKDG
ncbi:MAG TPA: hypothetical protein VF160_01700 [Candidatus Dormibacteraeota bacterium]